MTEPTCELDASSVLTLEEIANLAQEDGKPAETLMNLVVQTVEARAFREDEVRMLGEAAAQVAPVVSEARTLDRFIAPAQERLWALARNLWWSWDHDSSALFRDLDPVRWRQLNHNPIS